MTTKFGVSDATTTTSSGGSGGSGEEALRRRIVILEGSLSSTTSNLDRALEILASTSTELASKSQKLEAVTAERDKLRHAYEQLKAHLELLQRRLFVAKAERIDTAQLELEFAATKAKLDALVRSMDDEMSAAEGAESDPAQPPVTPPSRPGRKPSGRRNLRTLDLVEARVEILDPVLEESAERMGFEETCLLGRRRASNVRIVVARAKYKLASDDDATPIVTAPKPKELYERGILAPSFIAHLLAKKYRFGMPFHRCAEELASEGIPVDAGMMSRYAEHVGASLGPIVDECAKEAREKAFCLSTDATGVAIQPERIPGKRQACAKGHFFVVLADKDHVFFEYQAKHTSEAVCAMFRGFSGYIQADAHCVYDALFRGDALEKPGDTPPEEVGCWSHARRKFWEAATATKDEASREALLRIRVLFQLEEKWRELAPQQRHARRQQASRAVVEEFFAWAEGVFERVRGARGLVATAFGYSVRHREALSRFLDDGRLRLENNASERALRHIAIGRKAWLFFGSDDHAQAAANLFSLIASCKLHGLDAEEYLAEIIRIFPYWPRDRYLELAPKYWLATRARLDAKELQRGIGHVTVPPAAPPEEKASSS